MYILARHDLYTTMPCLDSRRLNNLLSDSQLQIYTETFRNLSKNLEDNFPLHHLVRISALDHVFSKILELTESLVNS